MVNKNVYNKNLCNKMGSKYITEDNNLKFYHYLIPKVNTNDDGFQYTINTCLVNDYGYQESLKNGNQTLVIARDFKYPNKERPSKQYAFISDPIDFFKSMLDNKVGDLNYYEVIFNRQQKIKWDIDIDIEPGQVDYTISKGKSVLKYLLEGINKFAEEVGENFKDDIIVTTSHREDKISYHVILNNHVVMSSEEAKEVYNYVNEFIPLDYVEHIDKSIYSDTQHFRMLFNSKMGKDNVKNIDLQNTTWRPDPKEVKINVNDKIIELGGHNNDTDEQIKRLRFYEASLVSCYFGRGELIVLSKNVTKSGKCDMYDEEYKTIHSIYTKSRWSAFYNIRGNISNGVIGLTKKTKSHMCPVHGRIHDNENPYIKVLKDGAILFCCGRPKEIRDKNNGKPIFIGRLTNKMEESNEETNWEKNYLDIIRCNSKYLPDYPADRRYLMVKSATGTGKTEFAMKFLEKVDPDNKLKVSFLSTRRVFTANATTRLSSRIKREITNYLEDPTCKSDCIFIQPESFYKDQEHRDVLIIDELPAVIDQFFSTLHRGKGELNRKLFKRKIRDAKYVLCLSSDIKPYHVDKLKEILLKNEAKERKYFYREGLANSHKIKLIINSYKNREGYDAIIMDKEEEFVKNIIDARREGKKISITSTTYKFATVISKILKDLDLLGKYRFYNGKDGDNKFYDGKETNQAEEVGRINNVVKDLDVLIHTGTISVGVDISIENYFDVVYGYLSPKVSISADDMQQMFHRVRDVKEKTVCLHIVKNNGKKTIRFNTIKRQIEYKINSHNNALTNTLAKLAVHDSLTSEFSRIGKRYYRTFKEGVWTDLFIHRQVELNKTWNNCREEIIKILKEKGYEVLQNFEEDYPIYYNIEDLLNIKTLIMEATQILKENSEEKLVNSESISARKAELLEKAVQSGLGDETTNLKLKKFHYCDHFIDKDDPIVIDSINKIKIAHVKNCVSEMKLGLLKKDINITKGDDSINETVTISLNNPELGKINLAFLEKNKDTLTDNDKLALQKLDIINVITDKLRLVDSLDGRYVTKNQIYNLKWYLDQHPTHWNRIFRTSVEYDGTLDSCIKYTRSVILKWNGCSFKRKNSNSEEYHIEPTKKYSNIRYLVDNYKVPDIKVNYDLDSKMEEPEDVPETFKGMYNYIPGHKRNEELEDLSKVKNRLQLRFNNWNISSSKI